MDNFGENSNRRPPQEFPGYRVRGEKVLLEVRYSDLAAWTGLGLGTIRQYVHRGVFDPGDFWDVVRWVESVRVRKGKGRLWVDSRSVGGGG